jgi:hypothetical protein
MCGCNLCRRRAALHGRGCRCTACRGGLMSFETTPAFRACEPGTRQRLVGELPAWSGWCHRMSLANLIAAQPSTTDPFQRPNAAWQRSGQLPIYRMVAGPTARRQQGRTHYVGLAFDRSGSVRQRLLRHLSPGNSDAASRGVRAFVERAGGPARVQVELGTAETRSPRLAHAVEILVQRAERVLEWRRINRTTTFDDFESALAGTLADLRRRA